MNYFGNEYYSDYISHHGILGQKWGIRRYQNKDGSLTEAGKKRINKTYSSKVSKNSERQKASDNYDKKFKYELSNKGYKDFDGDGFEATSIIGERRAAQIWNEYLDEYGNAVLKDAGIPNTKESKKVIDDILDSQKIYKYDMYDGNGKRTDAYFSKDELDEFRKDDRMRGLSIGNKRDINSRDLENDKAEYLEAKKRMKNDPEDKHRSYDAYDAAALWYLDTIEKEIYNKQPELRLIGEMPVDWGKDTKIPKDVKPLYDEWMKVYKEI